MKGLRLAFHCSAVHLMKNNQKHFMKTPIWHALICAALAVTMLILLHQDLDASHSDFSTLYIFLSVYVILCALVLIFAQTFRTKLYHEESLESISEHIPLSIYANVSTPIALCNENGLIVWKNSGFDAIANLSGTRTRTLRSILGFGLEKFESMNEEDEETRNGILWTSQTETYRVYAKRSREGNTLVWWIDVTELEKVRRQKEDEEFFLAYIYIDNIEELIQIERENTASLASTISNILFGWAISAEGVIKEFERNKFIFMFSRKAYTGFVENKFDILDKIRMIPIGKNTETPATISIGVSTISGTFAEKDTAAKAALELALARGGDQAVVKNENGIEFFGGMTKSSQKRSTVKSRTIANKLTDLICGSTNVLIMAHKYADFDALGACVGIARLVMQCEKPCYIISDRKNADLAKCHERLKTLHSYDNIFITAAEATELNYSETLLVIVDVNNPLQFEDRDIATLVRKTVFIDHHRMTGEFAKTPLLHYIEPSASSTCELICEILEQTPAGNKLSKQEADIMFAGIMLDTKRFVVNTGVRTFAAAQFLRGQGANPNEAQEFFKTGLDELIRKARFETNVETYRKAFAISISTEEECTAQDRIAAAKVADNLLTVDGILASFAICRMKDSIRISARSTGKINVQKILESIGGGGHYDSAATELRCSLEEAYQMLLAAIDKYLDE